MDEGHDPLPLGMYRWMYICVQVHITAFAKRRLQESIVPHKLVFVAPGLCAEQLCLCTRTRHVFLQCAREIVRVAKVKVFTEVHLAE